MPIGTDSFRPLVLFIGPDSAVVIDIKCQVVLDQIFSRRSKINWIPIQIACLLHIYVFRSICLGYNYAILPIFPRVRSKYGIVILICFLMSIIRSYRAYTSILISKLRLIHRAVHAWELTILCKSAS